MSAHPAPARFPHERVETITGRRSGLFIAVALHSSVLGSALGGARLWTYPHWSDALGDALRLSAAMTLKNAAAGLDAGGGKSVIALARGHRARRASAGAPRSSTSATPSSRCTASTARRRTSARRPRTCSIVSERTEPRRRPSRGRRRLGRARRPDEPRRVRVAARDARARDRHRRTSPAAASRSRASARSAAASPCASRRGRRAHGHRRQPRQARPRARSSAPTGSRPGEEHLVPADVFVPAGIGGLLTDEVIDALDARGGLRPGEQPARRSLAAPSGSRGAASCTHPTSSSTRAA